MNVLILGKGGREQAIVKALYGSPVINKIFILPGSDGFLPQATCLSNVPLDKQKLTLLVKKENIKLVIIGPENELAEGWADFFRSINILVFGPSQQAACLESSKLFAKNFMSSAGILTADFKKVCSVNEALTESTKFSFPVVLKADGLAAGKGVFICHNKKQLLQSAELLFKQKIFGKSGQVALLEEFKKGVELSVFVLTNGEDYKILPFAKDYKKLNNKDEGPNTGGMGAFAPHVISSKLKQTIEHTIVKPSIAELKKQKLFYRGILYIGLMMVNDTPFVLEYNVRFGDPETQVLLPLLDGDWLDVFLSVAKGNIPSVKWKNTFASCVVLAAQDYPLNPIKGTVITGDIHYKSSDSYFLHAGTKKTNTHWVTNGGRVLNSIGISTTKKQSLNKAYEQAKHVNWTGLKMRNDIGN